MQMRQDKSVELKGNPASLKTVLVVTFRQVSVEECIAPRRLLLGCIALGMSSHRADGEPTGDEDLRQLGPQK